MRIRLVLVKTPETEEMGMLKQHNSYPFFVVMVRQYWWIRMTDKSMINTIG